jgi:hypothetical protein
VSQMVWPVQAGGPESIGHRTEKKKRDEERDGCPEMTRRVAAAGIGGGGHCWGGELWRAKLKRESMGDGLPFPLGLVDLFLWVGGFCYFCI